MILQSIYIDAIFQHNNKEKMAASHEASYIESKFIALILKQKYSSKYLIDTNDLKDIFAVLFCSAIWRIG